MSRRRIYAAAVPQPVLGETSTPTVASLGVRLRVCPSQSEWDRDVAELIASAERLADEWDQLFSRAVDLLATKPRRQTRCRSSKT